MVFISNQAKIDLDNILIGLLTWEKHTLSVAFTENYIDEIVALCYTLDNKLRHQNCTYNLHQKYGDKFIRYQRNKKTTWYIIYNIDPYTNITIEKIISNYQTIY